MKKIKITIFLSLLAILHDNSVFAMRINGNNIILGEGMTTGTVGYRSIPGAPNIIFTIQDDNINVGGIADHKLYDATCFVYDSVSRMKENNELTPYIMPAGFSVSVEEEADFSNGYYFSSEIISLVCEKSTKAHQVLIDCPKCVEFGGATFDSNALFVNSAKKVTISAPASTSGWPSSIVFYPLEQGDRPYGYFFQGKIDFGSQPQALEKFITFGVERVEFNIKRTA